MNLHHLAATQPKLPNLCQRKFFFKIGASPRYVTGLELLSGIIVGDKLSVFANIQFIPILPFNYSYTAQLSCLLDQKKEILNTPRELVKPHKHRF